MKISEVIIMRKFGIFIKKISHYCMNLPRHYVNYFNFYKKTSYIKLKSLLWVSFEFLRESKSLQY